MVRFLAHQCYRLNRQTRLAILLVASFFIWAVLHPHRFIALWLTQDQLGKVYYELGDYQQAAQSFITPSYKGLSYQQLRDYPAAALQYGRFKDAQSLFAKANALSHARDFAAAIEIYQHLLNDQPNNKAVAHNLALVSELIDQTKVSGTGKTGEFVREDAPKRPSGKSVQKARGENRKEHQQYSAYAILRDPALNELWMKSVRKDPAKFLQKKFKKQHQSQQGYAND